MPKYHEELLAYHAISVRWSDSTTPTESLSFQNHVYTTGQDATSTAGDSVDVGATASAGDSAVRTETVVINNA